MNGCEFGWVSSCLGTPKRVRESEFVCVCACVCFCSLGYILQGCAIFDGFGSL